MTASAFSKSRWGKNWRRIRLSPRPYLVCFAENLPDASAKGFMRELEQLGSVSPIAPNQWVVVTARESEDARFRQLVARWGRAGSVKWEPFPN